VVQAVPHPGIGASWENWRRYEASVNDLLAALPLSGLCVYDRRITPPVVLDDVGLTHPSVRTRDGEIHPNHRYQAPATFLRSLPPPPPDPVEAEPPDLELIDPDPATARHAVRNTATRRGFPPAVVERLVLATSEAVTNGLVHGRPPVIVRSWARPRRVLVTVSDHGTGPTDPYVGLVPGSDVTTGAGGYGSWLIDQLVTTTHAHTPDGFTLRLVIGSPLPAQ
jgi:anti-sigma regulatory factor (Ser/Thr protein kinase)